MADSEEKPKPKRRLQPTPDLRIKQSSRNGNLTSKDDGKPVARAPAKRAVAVPAKKSPKK